MKKVALFKIDYREFIAPDCPIELILNVLEKLIYVKSTYIEGENIYEPEEKQPDLGIKLLPPSVFRKATPIELENKKIKDLESDLDYAKREKERILKEKTCLENELKAFKEEAGAAEKVKKQEVV